MTDYYTIINRDELKEHFLLLVFPFSSCSYRIFLLSLVKKRILSSPITL